MTKTNSTQHIQVSELTGGERLQIYRRRRGWTQARMAREAYRIAPGYYVRMENGQVEISVKTPMKFLRTCEQCYVARRRSGMSQEELARQLGVCRWHVVKMERGLAPCDALTDFWFA